MVTDAVTDQVEAIQSDVVQLRNSGSDVAADEISALGTAVDDLAAALDALGSDTSVDSAPSRCLVGWRRCGLRGRCIQPVRLGVFVTAN